MRLIKVVQTIDLHFEAADLLDLAFETLLLLIELLAAGAVMLFVFSFLTVFFYAALTYIC